MEEKETNDTTIITDFDFSLIADFFKRVNRQGPGGVHETMLAASLIPDFNRHLRIADIGCGSGSQTMVLADKYDADIDAVDLLPEMIEAVNRKCSGHGLGKRIHPIQASMDALPFTPESYDIIWAEGSIFVIGYENGLRYWHQFLKPGGFIAVTDCSWLSDRRPDNMDWINNNLPEIDSIPNKLAQMSRAGYEPYAHFILPSTCWTDNYYEPMSKIMDKFLSDHNYNENALSFISRMKEEIAYYEANKDYFGYVFYIGKKM